MKKSFCYNESQIDGIFRKRRKADCILKKRGIQEEKVVNVLVKKVVDINDR